MQRGWRCRLRLDEGEQGAVAGGAGLVIVADVAAAEKVLGATAARSAGSVVVPPAAGNGTLLVFVKA